MLWTVMALLSCSPGPAVAEAAAKEEDEGSGASEMPRRWASQCACSEDGPRATPKEQLLSDVPA